jgi:acylphosphatase
MKATRLLIRGIVQGVGFRYFAVRAARELGITGWVRNLNDGRVEAMAAGPSEALSDFIDRMRRGPRGAQVLAVETHEGALDETTFHFEILD